MKNLIFLICITFIIFSCNEIKPKVPQIIISGQIDNLEDSIIKLRQKDQTQEIILNENGRFTDTIYDFENGYFSLTAGREYTKLYLKDGDNISVKIDVEDFDNSVKYDGIGANENNFLAQQMLSSGGFNFWGLCKNEESVFISKIDSLVAFKNSALENHLLLVPEFDETLLHLEKTNNKYFSAYVKERYVSIYEYYNKVENFEVSADYYSFRNDVPLEDKEALKTQFYPDYVETYIENKIIENDSSEHAFEAIRTINREIQDNDLKKEFIYRSAKNNLGDVKKLDEYWAIISYMVTDKPKLKELKKKYNGMAKIQSGNKSPLTAFTDFEDKSFKLSDFKGKYIYIDMWAQWCGPCKREAPFLKEIEVKYADKDIYFLKLSLDEDKEAWKNYIVKNEATNHSFLVANNFDSEFAEAYLINSIPRFILLDKELNIIDSNAPRPSDDELNEVLDELL